ncbi:uncharacterized protein LOC126262832 [Schistocerca nitens]|uniref:uncharacterized protein LOC126262832 n=1 Tax=Schistocerca nitens TaxID=7011 RepID=UPI0021183F03|nr:uncharacterized protein LOC126262832 [Schistocerca nitens]XP_049815642.1 uncharacterized protein LOC126262832 [Schistocerca nitens]
MALQTAPMCKECGWSCKSCADQSNLHLHVEIENLKQRLLEREHHIVTMETNFLAEAEKFPNGEYAALTEELLMWQDKYSRLYESYKRVQKVNQNLEDKLLRIVDKCETEKNALVREVASLNQQLTDSRVKVNYLQNENERYRNDVNLAIQLLQCKPNNFVPQRYDSLPADLQQKVLSYIYMCGRRRAPDSNSAPIKMEMKTIKVPIPSSPPTSMVYSVNKNVSESDDSTDEGTETAQPPVDSVSAAIMAKVLEERQRERQQIRHCESCQCHSQSGRIVENYMKGSDATIQVDFPCLWCGQCADLGKTVIDATNRASQGLVRYVDVIATRTGETVSRSSQVRQNEIDSSYASNNSSGTNPTRLGIKIDSSRLSTSTRKTISSDVTCVPLSGSYKKSKSTERFYPQIPKAVITVGSSVPAVNGFTSEKKEESHKSYSELDEMLRNGFGNKQTSSVNNRINNSSPELKSVDFSDIDASENSKQTCYHNYVKHSVNNIKGVQNCTIDLEVVSDGKSDKSATVRTKSNGDLVNRAQVCQVRNTSENSGTKVNSWDGKSYINNDERSSSCSEGTRDLNECEKLIPYSTSEKCVSQVPFPGMVKPTETSISKLTFLNSSKPKDRHLDNSVLPGPRLCSMRMQLGSSNILLDNATAYEPVLYTGRSSHQETSKLWNSNCSRPGTAVLVHSPRSHSVSSTEEIIHRNEGTTNKSSQWLQDNPPETEI